MPKPPSYVDMTTSGRMNGASGKRKTNRGYSNSVGYSNRSSNLLQPDQWMNHSATATIPAAQAPMMPGGLNRMHPQKITLIVLLHHGQQLENIIEPSNLVRNPTHSSLSLLFGTGSVRRSEVVQLVI